MSDYVQILDIPYFQKRYKLLMFSGEYDPMVGEARIACDYGEEGSGNPDEMVFSIQVVNDQEPPLKDKEKEPYFIIVPRQSYMPPAAQKELTDVTYEIEELFRGLNNDSNTKDWMSGKYGARLKNIGWVPVEFSRIFEVHHEELDFKSVGQLELGKGRFGSLL